MSSEITSDQGPIPTLSPETRRAAAHTICEQAGSVAEALQLLAMLGLDGLPVKRGAA